MTKHCMKCETETPHTTSGSFKLGKPVGIEKCCLCGWPGRGGQKHELARNSSKTGKYLAVPKVF